jgi:hypothetical protein
MDNYREGSLVIRKGIATNAPVKYAGYIRVFRCGAAIEHPEVRPMTMLQKFLDILPAIAVKSFHSYSRKAHDDLLIG